MNETVRSLCQKILRPPIDISTLKLYASMKMLRSIMDTSGWKYPSAAFKSDLKLKPKIDELGNFLNPDFISSESYKKVFSEIYNEFSVLSFTDFLVEYAPGLVTNIDETLAVLREIDPDMSVEIQCKYILDMRRVQALRSSFSALGRWEIYQKLVRTKANSAPQLSDKDLFERLYTSVNCYSRSYRNKVSVADKKSIDVMREFHLPDEYLIQFYAQVRELIAESYTGKKPKAIKGITNPAHYIRKRIGLNPKLDPLELDRLLNDAAEQIVKIKRPTDFLRALKEADDSSLEIGFVRPKFLQKVTPKDTILIVNPAPDFIINWPEVLLDRTTFCMEYEIEAEILKHEFSSACFICFENLFDGLSEPVTQGALSNSYSQILIFGRGLPEKIQQQILIASSVLSPNGKISVLTSSVFLDQPTPFRWGAAYFMRGWSISLLPNDIANSELKRKIYIEEILDESYKDSIVFRAFERVEETSGALEVSPRPEVKMFQNELIDGKKTLRMLYREKLETKEKSVRNAPQEYCFTRDIRFWYTISNSDPLTNPKVEAYVCKLPTSAQKKRTKQARGAKIKLAYASTTKYDLEHLSDWLEEIAPYNIRIHNGVVQAFGEAKKSVDWACLTLKSYWYLGLNVSKISDDPWFEMERELFSSQVGLLTLLAEEEDIQEEMKAFLDGKTISGFSQVEDYRRLPIPHMLYVQLNERKKYIKKQLLLTSVNDFPIVAPDDILLKGSVNERLSPRALARLTRKVILEMGIPENVVYLPDKANGVKETNLSSYHGDIFRSHIRFRLNTTCGFTDAETRYFLGLTQISTFGKHYCDFRNDCAQMLMCQKLRRWEVKLSDIQESDLTYMRRQIDGRKSIDISSISSGRTVLDVNLKINSEDDGEVTFDSPGGIQGDIQWK